MATLLPAEWVDRERREVLDQGPAAPDIEGLDAVADAEDRFAVFVSVVEENVVGGLADDVGWGGGGVNFVGVAKGVDVGEAAREADAIASEGEGGDLSQVGGEVDLDGFAAGAGDGVRVLWPGTLVVGDVSGGWDGDRDARLHSKTVNRKQPTVNSRLGGR